jgi:hypothetical protein
LLQNIDRLAIDRKRLSAWANCAAAVTRPDGSVTRFKGQRIGLALGLYAKFGESILLQKGSYGLLEDGGKLTE